MRHTFHSQVYSLILKMVNQKSNNPFFVKAGCVLKIDFTSYTILKFMDMPLITRFHKKHLMNTTVVNNTLHYHHVV